MEQSTSHPNMLSSIANSCLSVRMRLLNRIIGAIYDEALRPHGIKASQMNILVATAAYGRSTIKDLCHVLHIDSSTFSRALAILKRNQWLHVEPSGEGRILKFEVTKEGLNKIEEVYPDWQRAQEKAMETLGESTSEMIIASGNKHLLGGMTA